MNIEEVRLIEQGGEELMRLHSSVLGIKLLALGLQMREELRREEEGYSVRVPDRLRPFSCNADESAGVSEIVQLSERRK